MQSVNPYNGELIASYTPLDDEAIDAAIKTAQHAFLNWRNTSFSYRRDLVLKLAEMLLQRKSDYALLMTTEMGKPIAQAEAEIEKCAWVCRYYADNAEEMLKDKLVKTEAAKSFVRYNPIGVVLAVMPWNFPFWQYFRFLAPTLMAGNVALLKHASNVSGCALAIEKLLLDAGFPQGVSQTLLIGAEKVKQVIEHPYVKAVTLTGSEAAGASVASIAGKNIKKTVLELGGSNAAIVMNDADLHAAANVCVMARFQNNGQSCIAAKRFLIHEEVLEDFLKIYTEKVSNLITGNPLEKLTQIGPMATEKLAVELENQMKRSVEMGAEIHFGGKREGAFFQPTIMVNVTPEMPVFSEETFGPLVAVVSFSTFEEAVNLSNQSEFGLGVSIFTQNTELVENALNLFDEGAVFVNEMVKSDPRLPFGGVKKSGYGRELADAGLLEFVNQKTVFIQ